MALNERRVLLGSIFLVQTKKNLVPTIKSSLFESHCLKKAARDEILSMLKIIDLTNIKKTDVQTVNAAFEVWQQVYGPILQQAGETLTPESFWKCRLLTVIESEEMVEGFMLHSIYDLSLKGLVDIGYFSPLSAAMKAELVDNEEVIFTCEWVTVHPTLRGRFSKVQIGDVVMGVGFRSFLDTPCTLAMGFSRTDMKADKMAESFGFENKGMIRRHDIECGIMMLRKENHKAHRYGKTQARIEELYHLRLNNNEIVSPINNNLNVTDIRGEV